MSCVIERAGDGRCPYLGSASDPPQTFRPVSDVRFPPPRVPARDDPAGPGSELSHGFLGCALSRTPHEQSDNIIRYRNHQSNYKVVENCCRTSDLPLIPWLRMRISLLFS